MTTGPTDPSGQGEPVTEPPAARIPAPRRSGRDRIRRRRYVAGVLGVAVIAVVCFVGWFLFEAYPIGGSGPAAYFEVAPGESISQVASTMAAKGIIGSTMAFRLDLLVAGTPQVQAGWYVLPTSSSFSTVRGVLANGPNAVVLPVLTGETTFDIAQALATIQGGPFASAFLSLARNGAVPSAYQPAPRTSLEGLIAPGAYVLVPGETPKDLLTQMVARFAPRAAAQGLLPTTTAHGLDSYQLIIAASIIEKEGYLARNMPPVATVVYNRLARGWPLQMDATVLYALHRDGGTVTHAMEQFASPYNSYLNTGLTPTPICIPSTEAIDAALHPAQGSWLYFTLVDRAGTLAFATTFKQQLANELLAQQRGL